MRGKKSASVYQYLSERSKFLKNNCRHERKAGDSRKTKYIFIKYVCVCACVCVCVRLLVGSVKKTISGVDYYYISSNYSGWDVVRDDAPEQQKLSYYLEDIGLNAYYFLMSHEFPYWMSSVKYNMPRNVRGALYLYTHKLMLIRYYLERLSNEMGEINYVDVNRPIVTGYYPMMHHQNGLPFPQRPVGSEIPSYAHKDVQVRARDIPCFITTKRKEIR